MAPKRRRNEKSPKNPFSDPRKSQKIAISRHLAFLRQNASFTHRHNSPFQSRMPIFTKIQRLDKEKSIKTRLSLWVIFFKKKFSVRSGTLPTPLLPWMLHAAIQIVSFPAHPPCVSVFIAAAPRPLRLRRGFVVTTAPLNSVVAKRFATCQCIVALRQSDFIISLSYSKGLSCLQEMKS